MITKYKNEALNIIHEKRPDMDIDFTSVDNAEPIFLIGELCEKLNLDLVFKKLDNGLSGYIDNERRMIYVNDYHPATRNLFTIAHEIGHYILHEGTNNRYDEYHNYTDEERRREYEANDFAGKLLMPEYKFVKIFQKYKPNSKKIADIFGVSVRACDVRAFNLGLIDSI